MAGTWTTIANAPPDDVATMLLLTDGTVLAQGYGTNAWYKLTPNAHGDYTNGTWTTLARGTEAPLYYASGMLRDGRVIYSGGEYDGFSMVFLSTSEIYDPIANTWTLIPPPAGWTAIGDSPGCVLPDGRWFVGRISTRQTAIFDPATNTWTATANKISNVSEEGWSLLPDGSILSVDATNPPNAEKYVIASNVWVAAGATPQSLVDGIREIGAQVLLPDGRVFVIGATGYTALYTPPPIANQVGTWVAGPTIPQVSGQPHGAVDAPACLLPNGRVLFTSGPITNPAGFHAPATFFEYEPATNIISTVPGASTAATVPYQGRMLMLPTGQVLYTTCSSIVDIYTPDDAPDPVWRPTITACSSMLVPGGTYTLKGRQINGLSQCVYYGNDATQATNYPIVRLESTTGPNVYYCRSTEFSTMGVNTGTVVHSCRFKVPSTVPLGRYCLKLIANGIETAACKYVDVVKRKKWFKELKLEIKDKLEILENIKLKRVPDIIDIKGIRENEIFELIEEEWVRTVRTVAEGIDAANAEFGRAFIVPAERPDVGPPEPIVEEITPTRISAAEARKAQEKHEYIRGNKVTVSKEAQRLHDEIHGRVGNKRDETSGRRSTARKPKPRPRSSGGE
ncbi:MAG: hypothetical protein P0111_18220 [Nitrospira sp.]|nr:hypothetical protein [Nitrospira sp.]